MIDINHIKLCITKIKENMNNIDILLLHIDSELAYRPIIRQPPTSESQKSAPIYQVIAKGTVTKGRLILGSYLDRGVAIAMMNDYFIKHWPRSAFNLSVEEVSDDA